MLGFGRVGVTFETDMKFIVGTKKYMSELFEEDGSARPVTVISVSPSVVTQVKSVKTDGYNALQIGYGVAKEKRVSKAVRGHTKDLGNLKNILEFRVPETMVASAKRGDKIDVSAFKPGESIEISAVSKGKGFQGTVKRHGFAGGRRTHGQKHSEREPGTISGGGRAGGRVAKGIRMSGRMGGDRITVRNLKIVQVDVEKNEIVIEGAIPGVRGAFVEMVSYA
jgi:large subunit ribosomal protein L3